MIYADNAATTKMKKISVDAMNDCINNFWGNPSSLYDFGQKAAEKLNLARKIISQCINADSHEIYFNSGGSEADNQAIISAAKFGAKKNKNHIISSKFEHHAVLHTLKKLEREGFEVDLLDVNENGIIFPEQIKNAIKENTCLVTIMFANNEIGTIQPIEEIGKICRENKIIFHTDAVQVVGHLPVDVKKLKIDMLSASSHKFNGPKGAGFLFVRDGIFLTSLIEGGAQEKNKRAGTENLPAIFAMAVALEDSYKNLEEKNKKIINIREKIIDGLLKIPKSVLNGDRKNRLPGNINFCFEGIEGESLLLLLDDKNICASSGSACTSGTLDPSHVLLAIGRPHEISHGSLRLSIDENISEEDAKYILKSVEEVVTYLRNISPLWKDKISGKKEFFL